MCHVVIPTIGGDVDGTKLVARRLGSHKKFSVAHLTSHTPRQWQKNRLLVNHPNRPLQPPIHIVNTSTSAEFHDESDDGNGDDRSALHIMNLLLTHHIRQN